MVLLGRAFGCCSSRSRSDSNEKTIGCIFEVESETKISSAALNCFVYIAIAIDANVDSMATIRDSHSYPKISIASRKVVSRRTTRGQRPGMQFSGVFSHVAV